MQSQIKYNYPIAQTVTIPLSGTTSPEIDLGDNDLVGIIAPATFDGTTITFTGATTANGTHFPVASAHTAATAYTVTTTASTLSPIGPNIFAGIRYVRAVCGTAQTTTATDLVFLLRKRT
jgi:hypothetical protein